MLAPPLLPIPVRGPVYPKGELLAFTSPPELQTRSPCASCTTRAMQYGKCCYYLLYFDCLFCCVSVVLCRVLCCVFVVCCVCVCLCVYVYLNCYVLRSRRSQRRLHALTVALPFCVD